MFFTGDLKVKLSKLREPHLFLSYSDGLGFCHYSMDKIFSIHNGFIREASMFPNHPNRIYYLAERLKVFYRILSRKSVYVWQMQMIPEDIGELTFSDGACDCQ